jgi:hypothetical protein
MFNSGENITDRSGIVKVKFHEIFTPELRIKNRTTSIAKFGMLLRGSEFKGSASYDEVLKRAKANVGEDKFGFRAEFVTLVENAQTLAPTQNGQINFK